MISDEQKTIGFRGTEEYRRRLQKAAFDRGMKVQTLLEVLVQEHVFNEPPQGATPLTTKLLNLPTDTDEKVMRKLWALWTNPKGVMGPEIRGLVAKAIGEEPPK